MDGYLLGSGGWLPTSRRETCCALFRDGQDALLVDAGTGVSRLLEHPHLIAGVQRLEIVLTHFHLDHVVGLSYLPALGLASPPVVWGPGRRLYDTPTDAILERLLAPPLFALSLRELLGGVREVPETAFSVAGFELDTRAQTLHAHPTLALRIGGAATYCTDTAFDPENAAFAAGSSVLLHEAWHALDACDDAGHTAAGEAAHLAERAGAESLVLIHINPLLADDSRLERIARARFEATHVGQDLAAIPLPHDPDPA